MKLKSIEQLDVAGKTVLVRTGFNVPVAGGRIADDFRLRAALPTLEHLASAGAKIVVISHFGRPEGWQARFTLAPVAERLAEILGRKFVPVSEKDQSLPDYPVPHLYFFSHNIEKTDIGDLVRQLKPGDIAVLENLRFYAGELANDENFAKKLASLGEMYVNEAFCDIHRDHASIASLPRLLPAAVGLEFAKEVATLGQFIAHPQKPVVIMMGGVKIASKVRALAALAKTADAILLGGGLAALFLKIAGFETGKSVWEESAGDEKIARQIWRDFRDKIHLPIDVVVTVGADGADGQASAVKTGKIRPGQIIRDIGPETILAFSTELKKGRTLIWSGPLGQIENHRFAQGTLALGRLFASRTKTDVAGIVGGGETLEIIKELGMASFIDHISTGGGSFLYFLAGEKLPGLAPVAV